MTKMVSDCCNAKVAIVFTTHHHIFTCLKCNEVCSIIDKKQKKRIKISGKDLSK